MDKISSRLDEPHSNQRPEAGASDDSGLVSLTLAEENEQLREEVRQLKEALAIIIAGEEHPFPKSWRLDPMKTRLLRALLREKWCSRQKLLIAMYFDREWPLGPQKSLDVQISILRSRLKPLGVAIINHVREGYSISPEHRAKLKALAGD